MRSFLFNKNNKHFFCLIFIVFCLTILFATLIMLFALNWNPFPVAAEEELVIYIESEQDFESFLLACSQHNVLTRDEGPILSATDSKKYILCTDIYLKRKNQGLDVANRIWHAQYFNGEFEGRGHSIVNFELDDEKLGLKSEIGNLFGYAFFSILGENAVVKDLNFVSSKVILPERETALVCGTNAGIIENVKAEGVVQGYKWVAGLCVANFGEIRNSLIIAKVFRENYQDEGGTTGYIAALNSATLFQDIEEDKRNCINNINYQPLYLLKDNFYFDFDTDDADSLMGFDLSYESYSFSQGKIRSYEYSQEDENVTESTNNDYLQGKIIDYFGVVWFLSNYKYLYEKGEDIDEVQIEVDINMYNVAINIYNEIDCFSYVGLLSEEFASKNGIPDKLKRNNHNFYNREHIDTNFIDAYENGDEVIPCKAISLLGQGTREYPYLLGSLEDLLAISDYSTIGTHHYYCLTRSISLLGYTFNAPIITGDFYGSFDGNDFSISGLTSSLFQSIELESNVKNLRLSSALMDEAALCSVNEGWISGIDVDLIGRDEGAVGIAYTNKGRITRSTVRIGDSDLGGGAFSYASLDGAKISFSRSLGRNFNEAHNIPFLAEQSSQGVMVSFSFNTNELWNLSSDCLLKCLWNEHKDDYYTTEESLYDLINIPTNIGTNILHNEGWCYAKDCGFAFLAGDVEDLPVLVFPSDNLDYKLNSFFKDRGAQIEGVNRGLPKTLNATDVSVELMLLPNPKYEELEEIDEDYAIALGDFSDFVIGSYTGYFEKDAIERLLFVGINDYVKNQIQEDSFDWTYNSQLFLQNTFEGMGEYCFSFYSDLIDIVGTFELLDEGLNLANINYSKTEYFFHYNSVFYNPFEIDLQESFEITKSAYQVIDEEEIYLNSEYIHEFGKFILMAEILATENRTWFSKKYPLEVEKGLIIINETQIKSEINGLTFDEDAPVFSGKEVVFIDSLYIESLRPGYVLELTKKKLIMQDSSEVLSPSMFLHAGQYVASLVIKTKHYQDYSLDINLFILPRKVNVKVLLLDEEIEFCQSLPEIEYQISNQIYNYQVQGLMPSTDYSPGSNIGDYLVTAMVEDGTVNNNYCIVYEEPACLTVLPTNFFTSANVFVDKSILYDGNYHSLNVNLQEVSFPTQDKSSPSINCQYSYLGENSSIPYYFKNSGMYQVSVTIFAGSNYFPKELTKNLSIERRKIVLTVNSHIIDYGDDTPTFSISGSPAIGELSSTLILNELTEASFSIEYQCLYLPNSMVGWSLYLNDTEEHYELPINANCELGNYNNFEIINQPIQGWLQVNKLEYSGALVDNNILYTGNKVALQFVSGLSLLSMEYVEYYEVKDSIETLLEEPPQNVSKYADDSRPRGSFYRIKTSFLGNYKYLPNISIIKDYDIIQANLAINGLYLSNNGVFENTPISEVRSIDYMGRALTVSVKESEMPQNSPDSFRYVFKYNGLEVEDNYILIKDAGVYEGVEVQVSCVNEQNYKPYNSPYKITLTILPLKVYLNESIEGDKYNASVRKPGFSPKTVGSFFEGEFSEELFEYTIISYQALNYSTGNYSVVASLPTSILLPGKYEIDVCSTNANYLLGDENHQTILYKLDAAMVELDLDLLPETRDSIFEETYLNLKNNVLSPIDISLSLPNVNSFTRSIEFIIGTSDLFVAPGEYDIVGAKDILHYFQDEDVFIKCIGFSVKLISGKDKLKVNKRQITLSWEKIFNEEYEYTGQALSYQKTVSYTKGENSLIQLVMSANDSINQYNQNEVMISTLNIEVAGNKPLLNAGSYLFVAICNHEHFFIAEEGSSFAVNITPISLSFEREPCELFSGDELPNFNNDEFVFSAVNEENLLIFQGDVDALVINYLTPYDSSEEHIGPFEMMVSMTVLGKEENYLFAENAIHFAFSKREFEPIVILLSYEYTGEPINIEIGNIPIETEITQDIELLEVGSYEVLFHLNKKHYESYEFSKIITVTKGLPSVSQLPPIPIKVLYRSNYTFNNSLIKGEAIWKDSLVEGSYMFLGSPTLKYGQTSYEVEFVPNDYNLMSVVFDIIIESYLEETDVMIVGFIKGESQTIDESVNEIFIEEGEIFSISLSSIEDLQEDVELYVNGLYIYGGEYTFTGEMEDVIIEILTSNGVIFSRTFDVKYLANENIQQEDVQNDEPIIGTLPEKLTTWAIVGIVSGSLGFILGITFLVILLIKKKNQKNE